MTGPPKKLHLECARGDPIDKRPVPSYHGEASDLAAFDGSAATPYVTTHVVFSRQALAEPQ